VHAPDVVLGWTLVPGHYQMPAYVPGGARATVTIWDDRTRATSKVRKPRDTQVLLLGCSFTYGWAISDDETYAWKLQERLPEVEILDAATSAYGTYQSLLRLERHLAGAARPPAVVVYGLFGEHATRNVGDPRWIRVLSQMPDRGEVAVPYCQLDDRGDLACIEPALRDTLASVAARGAPSNGRRRMAVARSPRRGR